MLKDRSMIFAIVLVAIIFGGSAVISDMPGPSDAEASDISYTYEGTTLTISSAAGGAMPDYTAGNAPWYSEAAATCKAIVIKTSDDGESYGDITSIGDYAFYGFTALTTFYVDQYITDIGDAAFAGCTALTKFTLNLGNRNFAIDHFDKTEKDGGVLYSASSGMPLRLIQYPLAQTGTTYTVLSGTSEIGVMAFKGETDLTSLTLPQTMLRYEKEAFSGCSKITSLDLKNPQSIDISAFDGMSKLQSVSVDEGNQYYETEAGVLLTNMAREPSGTEYKTLIFAPKNLLGQAQRGSDYVFLTPFGTEVIGEGAFSGCRITGVYLTAGLIYIEDRAFESCTKLTDVYIPNTVVGVGASAFEGCTALKAAYIPAITYSGGNEFKGCTSLAVVYTQAPSGTDLSKTRVASTFSIRDNTLPETWSSTSRYISSTEQLPTMWKTWELNATGWSGYSNLADATSLKTECVYYRPALDTSAREYTWYDTCTDGTYKSVKETVTGYADLWYHKLVHYTPTDNEWDPDTGKKDTSDPSKNTMKFGYEGQGAIWLTTRYTATELMHRSSDTGYKGNWGVASNAPVQIIPYGIQKVSRNMLYAYGSPAIHLPDNVELTQGIYPLDTLYLVVPGANDVVPELNSYTTSTIYYLHKNPENNKIIERDGRFFDLNGKAYGFSLNTADVKAQIVPLPDETQREYSLITFLQQASDYLALPEFSNYITYALQDVAARDLYLPCPYFPNSAQCVTPTKERYFIEFGSDASYRGSDTSYILWARGDQSYEDNNTDAFVTNIEDCPLYRFDWVFQNWNVGSDGYKTTVNKTFAKYSDLTGLDEFPDPVVKINFRYADPSQGLSEIAPEPGHLYADVSKVKHIGRITDTITYIIVGDTLIVHGTGEIPDYDKNTKVPDWRQYLNVTSGTDVVKHIHVCEGITSIGAYAFYNTANKVTGIQLPRGLDSIGANAFSGTAIRLQYIPNSVTDLDPTAFDGCASLRGIECHTNAVYSTDDRCVYSKDYTKLILVPQAKSSLAVNGLTRTVDANAAKGTSLTSLNLVNVTAVGNSAFSGTKLKEVTITGNFTLGTGVFEGCTDIEMINITASKNIEIPADTFKGCTGLVKLDLSKASDKIAITFGSGCLPALILYEGGVTPVDIREGVYTDIKPGKTYYTSTLDLDDCGPLQTLKYMIDGDTLRIYFISGAGTMYDYSETPAPWSPIAGQIKYVVVGDGTKTIGANAFQSLGISSVTLPNSCIQVGNQAFKGCTSLVNADLGGVTTFGTDLFDGDSALKSVTIGADATAIPSGAFGTCSALDSMVILGDSGEVSMKGDTLTGTWWKNAKSTVEGNVVFDGSSSTDRAMAKGSVYTSATAGWEDISEGVEGTVVYKVISGGILFIRGTSATISDNVMESFTESGPGIEDWAEVGDVRFVDVGTIGDYAFKALPITSVDLTGVISIGEGAFQNTNSLGPVEIPATVTSIGNKAFEGSGISTVELGHLSTDTVTIGQNAFADCDSLTGITIPSAITSIGSGAFSDTAKLSEFMIYTENLTSIGAGIFSGNPNTISIYVDREPTLGGSYYSYSNGVNYLRDNDWYPIVNEATFADFLTGTQVDKGTYGQLMVDIAYDTQITVDTTGTPIGETGCYKSLEMNGMVVKSEQSALFSNPTKLQLTDATIGENMSLATTENKRYFLHSGTWGEGTTSKYTAYTNGGAFIQDDILSDYQMGEDNLAYNMARAIVELEYYEKDYTGSAIEPGVTTLTLDDLNMLQTTPHDYTAYYTVAYPTNPEAILPGLYYVTITSVTDGTLDQKVAYTITKVITITLVDGTSEISTTVKMPEIIMIPSAQTPDGAKFLGWYDAPQDDPETVGELVCRAMTYYQPTDDITLYAWYKLVEYATITTTYMVDDQTVSDLDDYGTFRTQTQVDTEGFTYLIARPIAGYSVKLSAIGSDPTTGAFVEPIAEGIYRLVPTGESEIDLTFSVYIAHEGIGEFRILALTDGNKGAVVQLTSATDAGLMDDSALTLKGVYYTDKSDGIRAYGAIDIAYDGDSIDGKTDVSWNPVLTGDKGIYMVFAQYTYTLNGTNTVTCPIMYGDTMKLTEMETP